jgi:hypothetical protein
MHDTPSVVLLVGLALFASPLAQGADLALDRATLRGLTGVRVLVAPLKPEVERDGLTKRQLQTDVERRLHKAGIRVLTDLEREATPGGPLLSIAVATATQAPFPHLYALSIVVSFHQNALLERDLSIGAEKASTWSVSVIDLVDRQQLGTAWERVAQLVDRFINAYIGVNPKQERSRH